MALARPDWRWLGVPFLGSSLSAWMAALAIAAVSFLALILIKRLVVRRLVRRLGRRLERRGGTAAAGIDDLVLEFARRTRRGLLLLPVIYFGSFFLTLPAHIDAVLRSAAILALLVQLALWSLLGIDFWVARTRRRRLADDAASVTLIGVLGFIAKMVLGIVLFLLILDNLGVNVTALVAGLGIGGVAVALALQKILGDLLASLSIVLDKPFVLGDTINVGDLTGTVENIGLKTTRLRGTAGEQLIFSNSDLLQSRIRNYKRMTERHAVLSLGVAHGTPAAVLAAIPGLVREIVAAQEQVRFDRAHLKRFTDCGPEIEVAYTVLSPDFNLHMDRQQAILLALLRRFETDGIALAAPVRTVRLEGPPPAPPAEATSIR